MEFDKGQFWVHAHDLPLGLLNPEFATTIAQSSGKLIDLGSVGDGPQTDRDFLRFRVEVNIPKPLLPWFFIPCAGGLESWVMLKYERLSDFCYHCGCLGHCHESCTKEVIDKFVGKWSAEMHTTLVRRLQTSKAHPSSLRHLKKPNTIVDYLHHTLPHLLSPSPTTSMFPRTTGTTTHTTVPTSIQTTPTSHVNSVKACTTETNTIGITTSECSNYYVTEPLLATPTFINPLSLTVHLMMSALLLHFEFAFLREPQNMPCQPLLLQFQKLLHCGFPLGLLVKINCDAAFKDYRATFGIVARDSIAFLLHLCGNSGSATFSLHVEVIAVHSACSLASQHGWSHCIVESNSQMAISLSSKEIGPPWSLAALITDTHL